MMPSAARALAALIFTLLALGAPPASAAVDASFNFQPANTPTVTGYTPDTGAPYSSASGRGWVRADSLGLPSSQHVPLDLSQTTRDRGLLSDQLLDTIIHMRHPTNGLPEGAWEMAVPNGSYTVSVTVGDQYALDSNHVVRLEGEVAVDAFVPTSAKRFSTVTKQVDVTDGRLTVDQIGGTNTKLAWITVVDAPAPPPPPVDVDEAYNFQPDGRPTVTGYTPDTGAPYSPTTGRGWVRADSIGLPSAQHVPLDLSTTTRDRGLLTDQLLDTIIHLRHPTNGLPEGAWEREVPNGSYTVTVSVGDEYATDSRHVIRAEGNAVVPGFVPSAGQKFLTASLDVNVADGRLTIDQVGGSNTKLNWIRIASSGGGPRPSVGQVTPADGVSSVPRDRAITAEVVLPNVGGGIDTATLTDNNVYLARVSDGIKVPAHLNTSGGGDVIVLQPTGLLDPTTEYRFSVTDGLKDVTGARFIPRTTSFTTGIASTTANSPVRFAKAPQSAGAGQFVASVEVGPDHRLYATTLDGKILRFPIGSDGSLGTPTTINTIINHEGGPRHVIGLAFDPASTSSAPILWVTHSDAAYTNAPNWAGKISRLSGTNLSAITDVVVGLPRSVRDHETNSLAFGPDGALYLTQGSLSAMGAPDNAWGDRQEELLSAAVLRLNTTAVTSPPLNVKTAEGGTYNPFASGAPLTIYATGVRNAFDLVWHSNGQLYVPVNGSAAGGNIPSTPATLPSRCAARIDAAANGPWTGPSVTGATAVGVQPDLLLSVKRNRYYGHPNPSRCEYASFGGNPTSGVDPFEQTRYAVGTQPDRNWDRPAFDFGAHYSPNGVIEYHGAQWGGALDHALLVVRYSAGDDLVALPVSPTDGRITGAVEAIPGLTGFTDPLDVAQDPQTGNLYVTELGAARITLLRPDESGTPAVQVTPTLHAEDAVVGATATSDAVTVKSTGSSALTITGLSISGPNAADFSVAPPSTLPVTVAAGSQTSVRVSFRTTVVGIRTATLVVNTNAGTRTVELRGLGTQSTGGSFEPSLQRILELFRIGVDVGDADAATTALPVGSRLGDEVTAQRFRKAGSDPVSLETLAVFGPTGPNGNVGQIGWVPGGSATTRTNLLTIPNGAAQDVSPAVSGVSSFDPGSAAFGLFTTFENFGTRAAFTEDALNTMAGGPSHQARVFELRSESGGVVPDAYVVAFEDIPAGTGSDYNDVVVVVRGVTPVDVGAARLEAVSQDPAPYPDRLSFSRIGTATPSQYLADDHQHDEATVRIVNRGGASASVTALTTTGPFSVISAPTLPATLAAGASIDVRVRFTATSGRVSSGRLEVATTATATPVVGVELAGYWQRVPEGGQEPTLSEVVRNVLGYGTTIVGSGQVLNGKGHVEQVGDEILAPYWKRVDPTAPARLIQLAAYHGQGSLETFRYALRGAEKTAARSVGTHDPLDAQTMFPHTNTSTINPVNRTFSPPAAFAFNIASEWSDPTMNNAAPDLSNGCTAPCGHHVRAWPVKDRIGRPVRGTYIVAMDYSGINYDYQDNVYLVQNVEPDDEEPVLLRYDVGSTTPFTDAAGNVWAADTGLFTPSSAISEGAVGDAISATADDRLYATYRGNVNTSTQSQRVLSFTIPVTGASRVDVRLGFAERFHTAAGARVFDVFAENLLKIDNLDIFARSGGKNVAWTEELRNVDVSDGVLTLRLAASVNYPALSSIEVRCAAGCDVS